MLWPVQAWTQLTKPALNSGTECLFVSGQLFLLPTKAFYRQAASLLLDLKFLEHFFFILNEASTSKFPFICPNSIAWVHVELT